MIDNAKYRNSTETALVKDSAGTLYGIIVNSHSSGTLKLIDGYNNGAVATSALTSSGACVPADYATNTLTSTGTAVADGATVTVNTTVYTAKTALTTANAVANEVLIGSTADGSAFLANLKKAINGTGVAGVNYGVGTIAHPEVVADTLTSTTLKIWARTLGTTPNAYATTETSAQLSWADTTLGGGTGVSDPGVTAAGATITIGTTTYTAVIRLAESIGMTSVANQVLWVTSEAVFLDNFKSAINGSGSRGTDYSTATPINPDVFATTNTNTVQTIVARKVGTSGNAIATTETLANYAWTSTVMASGTLTDGNVLMNTYTPATGSSIHMFPVGISVNTGLLAVAGGTSIDYTLIYS